MQRAPNGKHGLGVPKEWKPPGKKTIERAAANARQVAICLAGGELVYFELDAAGTVKKMKADKNEKFKEEAAVILELMNDKDKLKHLAVEFACITTL